MRFLVAHCSVTYAGRLGASLAPGVRLVLWKADGSIAVHSDGVAELAWRVLETSFARERN